MGNNESKNVQEGKIATEYLPTKFMLYIRIIIGGYLMYLAYQIGNDAVVKKLADRAAGEQVDMYQVVFFGVAAFAFMAIGLGLVIHYGLNLRKGRFVGGPLDGGSEETGEEEVTSVEVMKNIEEVDAPVAEIVETQEVKEEKE